MVIVVAAILSFASIKLGPIQERNVEIEKKQNLLSSMRVQSTADDAIAKYSKYITDSYVLDAKGEKIDSVDAFFVSLVVELHKKPADRKLPVYIGTLDSGEKLYILPLQGKGLWGPIWGYISLKQDFSSVYGAYFSHSKETPGLGAEISTAPFQDQFIEKKILDEQGNFVSIKVVKGGAKDGDEYGVDAISGGTITSHGVQDMIHDIIEQYEPFIKKSRQ